MRTIVHLAGAGRLSYVRFVAKPFGETHGDKLVDGECCAGVDKRLDARFGISGKSSGGRSYINDCCQVPSGDVLRLRRVQPQSIGHVSLFHALACSALTALAPLGPGLGSRHGLHADRWYFHAIHLGLYGRLATPGITSACLGGGGSGWLFENHRRPSLKQYDFANLRALGLDTSHVPDELRDFDLLQLDGFGRGGIYTGNKISAERSSTLVLPRRLAPDGNLS